jgi:hypothetical protein
MLTRELNHWSFAAMPIPAQQAAVMEVASRFKGMSLEEAAKLLIMQVGTLTVFMGKPYFRFTFVVRDDLYAIDVLCSDADPRIITAPTPVRVP